MNASDSIVFGAGRRENALAWIASAVLLASLAWVDATAATTPELAIDFEPLQAIARHSQVTIPVTLTNLSATTLVNVTLRLERKPGYSYGIVAGGPCGALSDGGFQAVSTLAPIGSQASVVCNVIIARAIDADLSFHAYWEFRAGDRSVSSTIALGDIDDLGLAIDYVASPDDPRLARFQLHAHNDGADTVTGKIRLGSCFTDALVVEAGSPDGCEVHTLPCSQHGGAPYYVQLPSIAADATATCTVDLRLPQGDPDDTTASFYDVVNSVTGAAVIDAEARNNSGFLAYGQPYVTMNQSGLRGSWVNPQAPGQGIVFDVQPNFYGDGQALLFGGWFTFTDDGGGGPRWYTVQAGVQSNTSNVLVYRTVGGAFDSAQPTTTKPFLLARLTFADCTHGKLEYFDGEVPITVPLTRLLSNVACSAAGDAPPVADPSYALSGTWSDAGNSGQGIVFDIDPLQHVLFGAWYTFAFDSPPQQTPDSQRWYTLQATLAPGATATDAITIYETSGGVMDQTNPVVTRAVGTAHVQLHGCNAATLDYWFTDPSGLRQGSLALARLGAPPPGCAL